MVSSKFNGISNLSNPSIKDILSTLAERGRSLLDLDRYSGDPEKNLRLLCDDLLSMAGEASGVAMAQQVIVVYQSLGDEQKGKFFQWMQSEYGPDEDRLNAAIAAYEDNASDQTLNNINRESEPRRHELLRRLNLAPGGTAALVSMRADLLKHLKSHPQLSIVDNDFQHLFSSWFNRGFLVIKRIDWHTSAAVLEKITQYEAVHAIRDWRDLRGRIEPSDRRCYAFFHPALEDEPLIFVEIALTRETTRAIAPVLSESRDYIDARDATTAVFYSISNCQPGLKGISFGSFLIKQVLENLKGDLPDLKNFVTLSPVPGFMKWLNALPDQELGIDTQEKCEMFRSGLSNPDWCQDAEKVEDMEQIIRPLAARYFLYEKKKGKPLDPVARFHLGNGASLERINWLADMSENALKQSAGIMVNYRYIPKDIEKNHELYVTRDEVVAANRVGRVLKKR